MGKIIIYHHGDTDGKTAGACIYHLINIDGYTDKKCVCMYNYDLPFDFTEVEKDDLIFIVDYSLSNKSNVTKLSGLCKDLWNGCENKHVLWFDHHKTSFDLENTYPFNKITSIIDTSVCGTIISYLVGIQMCNSSEHTIDKLISSVNNTKVILKSKDYRRYCCDNNFVMQVDSWDTWKHNMPNSVEFNIGCMSIKELQDPSNEIYKYILKDDAYANNFTYVIIDKAKYVKDYLDTVNRQNIIEMGYEFTLDGYKCIMLNGRGNSTTFGDYIKKYDICAMFYFDGNTYFYSLYSETVDTSIISRRMGGGGHPGASGFQTKELLFKEGTDFKTEDVH